MFKWGGSKKENIKGVTKIILVDFAKLSQAPAPAGLSLALFSNYPATRPDRPDPTGIVNFWAMYQPVLDAIQPQSS